MTLDSSCQLIEKSMTSARSSFGEAQAFYGGVPRSIAPHALALLDDGLRKTVTRFCKEYHPGVPDSYVLVTEQICNSELTFQQVRQPARRRSEGDSARLLDGQRRK